jgi:hypothetical protein
LRDALLRVYAAEEHDAASGRDDFAPSPQRSIRTLCSTSRNYSLTAAVPALLRDLRAKLDWISGISAGRAGNPHRANHVLICG